MGLWDNCNNNISHFFVWGKAAWYIFCYDKEVLWWGSIRSGWGGVSHCLRCSSFVPDISRLRRGCCCWICAYNVIWHFHKVWSLHINQSKNISLVTLGMSVAAKKTHSIRIHLFRTGSRFALFLLLAEFILSVLFCTANFHMFWYFIKICTIQLRCILF